MIGALPSVPANIRLIRGVGYTLTISINTVLVPNEETVKKAIEPFIKVVSISRGLLSRSFTVGFTPQVDTDLGKVINYIRSSLSTTGIRASITDFKGGFPEPTTIIPSPTAMLKDIKTIAIFIGLGAIAYYISPAIKYYFKGRK